MEDGGAEAVRETSVEEALPLGPQPLPELVKFRNIEDPATMKALADPLRLKIMRVLGKGARVKPRIMTVKQLAEELGEPTTKLYRHIKQLVAVGLIQVAELRLVGGIVEQHYRVAQAGWGVNPSEPEMPDGKEVPEEVFGLVGAAIEEYFNRYETALHEGRTFVRNEDNLANPPHVRSVGAITDYRVPRDKAAEFADRLHKLVKEFAHGAPAEDTEETDAPDAVSANMLVMFYATEHDPDNED
jgi:DNA-binding transcriptional ArsR family regulator